jgi:SAM-dependent methyltransferase
MNESAKARTRREALGWYTRYFTGSVLDIGCGADKVVEHAIGWDLPQGDAQKLDILTNESFDTVYSSHCIEHMRSPEEAVRNWWRVLKPGGYLIIVGPDEDLYEGGHWPSRWNGDHKITLTLNKATSWSPVTYNLIELIQALPNHKLISAQIVDTNYDYTKLGKDEDQTSSKSDVEAACEIVVQKIAIELPFMTHLKNTMLCPKCRRMEIIVRGTLAKDMKKLDVLCSHCGTFANVTFNAY